MIDRILILRARTMADIARAGRLVREYRQQGYPETRKPGVRHSVCYVTEGSNDPACVWHTANQITVSFDPKETTGGESNGNPCSAD